MLVERLTTSEWIKSLDIIQLEKMREREDFDSYIHVAKPEATSKTQCERDSDTLTYVLTWQEYIEAASGMARYPYQGKIPYCGTCLQPVLF